MNIAGSDRRRRAPFPPQLVQRRAGCLQIACCCGRADDQMGEPEVVCHDPACLSDIQPFARIGDPAVNISRNIHGMVCLKEEAEALQGRNGSGFFFEGLEDLHNMAYFIEFSPEQVVGHEIVAELQGFRRVGGFRNCGFCFFEPEGKHGMVEIAEGKGEKHGSRNFFFHASG